MTEYNDVIVERFARAWASIDGKADKFDQERGRSYLEEDNTGTFEGYMVEALELLRRANCYVATSDPKPLSSQPQKGADSRLERMTK